MLGYRRVHPSPATAACGAALSRWLPENHSPMTDWSIRPGRVKIEGPTTVDGGSKSGSSPDEEQPDLHATGNVVPNSGYSDLPPNESRVPCLPRPRSAPSWLERTRPPDKEVERVTDPPHTVRQSQTPPVSCVSTSRRPEPGSIRDRTRTGMAGRARQDSGSFRSVGCRCRQTASRPMLCPTANPTRRSARYWTSGSGGTAGSRYGSSWPRGGRAWRISRLISLSMTVPT